MANKFVPTHRTRIGRTICVTGEDALGVSFTVFAAPEWAGGRADLQISRGTFDWLFELIPEPPKVTVSLTLLRNLLRAFYEESGRRDYPLGFGELTRAVELKEAELKAAKGADGN